MSRLRPRPRAEGIRLCHRDRAFLDRTLSSIGGGRQAADGSWWDPDGLLVEQFGLFDNLMIEGGITDSGGVLIREDQDRWNDLSVFERCVQAAASVLATEH